MDLEGNILSEISQTKTNIAGYHLYEESKIQTHKTKQTQNRMEVAREGEREK